jgi:molybdenum cofactor biosynthesis protein B
MLCDISCPSWQKEKMTSASTQQHKEIAAKQGPVHVAVITVSDTRTRENDTGGDLIDQRITDAGHVVVFRAIVKDEPEQIDALLDKITTDTTARLVLFTGGTGIAPRDTTYDVISRKLEKVMPGFGELFRMLSYNEVGAAAMLSRATAGVYRGRVFMSMPGSPNAVQVAMDKLILPEIEHLAWEVVR